MGEQPKQPKQPVLQCEKQATHPVWKSEDISMDQLPTRLLLAKVVHLIRLHVAAVVGEVVSQVVVSCATCDSVVCSVAVR